MDIQERKYCGLFEKPLDEINQDIFFRVDNFKNESWYGDLQMFLAIGICDTDKECALTMQKALKILGFSTRIRERENKLYILPQKTPPEHEKNKEEITMAYNNRKASNEPQSLEALTAKLEQCKQLQETMKEVNAYWRARGTCVGAPGITEEQAKKLNNKIATATVSWEKQPFSSYDLTNNNSQIKRLESKVKEVDKGFSGWDFEGGYAEANTEMNRLQLFFDEKPNDAQRAVLKSNGFKWAPSQDAWQRQLTDNAIYSAGRIDFIKPSDGRTVREHQPKAPARDAGAR